jgi:hypothetical protein
VLSQIGIQTDVQVSNIRNPTFQEVKTVSNIDPFAETEVRDTIMIKSGYQRVETDKSDMNVLTETTTKTEIPRETMTRSTLVSQSQYMPTRTEVITTHNVVPVQQTVFQPVNEVRTITETIETVPVQRIETVPVQQVTVEKVETVPVTRVSYHQVQAPVTQIVQVPGTVTTQPVITQ